MRPPFHAGHTLGLGAALLLPVALYANLGAAPLFIVTCVLTLITWAGRRPVWADARGPLLFLILALPVWALISALWSITPGESVKTGISFLGTCIGGAVMVSTAVSMTPHERETFMSWIIWGGAFGFALMFIDLFFDGPIYSLFTAAKGAAAKNPGAAAALAMNAGGVAAALFAWCWGAALRARYGRGVCIAGLIFACAAVMRTQAETPVITLAAGGAAAAVFFALHGVHAGRARTACAGLAAAFVMLTPVAVNATPHVYDILAHLKDYDLPQSARLFTGSVFHRLTIWQTAAAHVAESPLTGIGFDTARALYGAADRVVYSFLTDSGITLMNSDYEPIPLHPHNAVLQIWLELGVIGALAAAGLLARLFWRVSAVEDSAPRFFVCAVFFSGLAASSAAFGAWQSWWLGALFIIAASAAALAPPVSARPSMPGDVQKQV